MTLPPSAARLPGLLLLMLGLLLPGSALEGQAVTGRLADGTSERGIEGGIVRILNADGDVVAASPTDSLGHFAIYPPAFGEYYLSALAYGYRPVIDGPFSVTLAEFDVTVYVVPQPVQIEGFEAIVKATDLSSVRRRDYLERQGYFDRQRVGIGLFIEADSLGREAFSARDFLRGKLGVSQMAASTDVLSLTRCGRFGGYINGARVYLGGAWELDNELSAADIFAIEIYPSIATLPFEFSAGNVCGAVMVWTR